MTIAHTSMTRQSYTPGRPGAVRMIVMHATAGSYPGDYNWLRHGGGFVNGADSPVSVHYYITKTGETTQFVKDGDTAWHAGKSTWPVDGRQIDYNVGCNPVAVGIELENKNTGRDPYPSVQYQAALSLTRDLVAGYAIPQSQLVRHLDIAPGRKTDPAGFPWTAFVSEVYSDVAVPLGRYRVKAQLSTDPADNYAQVRIARSRTAKEAMIGEASVRLQPGTIVEIDDIRNGWAHIAQPAPWGYIALSLLERAQIDGGLTFLHDPRISKNTFVRVLVRRQSPAAADGPEMYDAVTSLGVDPAVFLGFFLHENEFGRTGLCKAYDLKNPGNVRTPFNPKRGRQLVIPGRGNFFKYNTWLDGAIDWSERMLVRYVDPTNSDPTFAQSLDTVEKATPIYAPSSDNNDPGAYARAVRKAVEQWVAEDGK